MNRAAVAAVLAACLILVGASGAKLERIEAIQGPIHHLMYLPNGKYLKVATLGNSLVAADLIYLWSIQFYANFQVTDRYAFVDHIYAGIITELDPQYFDPYWLGALILSVENHDLDRALALLDKGFANNPGKWIFPYLAGWECAYAKRYDRAIEYFKKAAGVPGAPPDVERLIAGMYQKEGDARMALREWQRIAVETTDEGVRKVAENRARALRMEVGLEDLREVIARYKASRGAPPRRLEDLVRGGFLRALPEAPEGVRFEYDPVQGIVSAGEPRVLPQ